MTSKMNRILYALFGMHNRTLRPKLQAEDWNPIPLMGRTWVATLGGTGQFSTPVVDPLIPKHIRDQKRLHK
jgi:hypothetical protein